MDKIYQLYISYSWTYNIHACKKKIEFFKRERLQFCFHEALNQEPKLSGISKETFLLHIEAKIKISDCILILAGTDIAQNYWTLKEIELARQFNKPVIVIEPWQSERTLPDLRSQADIVVKWHGKMISDAIRAIA